MASVEARLQEALTNLRHASGTVSVLKLSRERAQTLLADIQDALNHVTSFLSGDAKKEALRIAKLCEDWRNNDDRINV